MVWWWLALPALGAWAGLLLLPWRPWSTAERLEAVDVPGSEPLDDVTVLIPARNEAPCIARTLAALRQQGTDLRVLVVDDQSEDGTAAIARRSGLEQLEILGGGPVPEGWSGKLWALDQGRQRVQTPLILLLDADIELQPGMIPVLRRKLRQDGCQLVSLMAWLRMEGFWERLLMPAFIYFFKLLYPFRLANSRLPWMAAAAGGCVLVESAALRRIGGFASLRDALIDDCTLARRIKAHGGRTWIGLSHGARSLRSYGELQSVWDMVARTAFTQLRYSTGLLLACTVIMAWTFLAPWLVVAGAPATGPVGAALAALALMTASYLPTLRYYGLSPLWALGLPAAATLFLAMTWSSALRYWGGRRSQWKGRVYQRAPGNQSSEGRI